MVLASVALCVLFAGCLDDCDRRLLWTEPGLYDAMPVGPSAAANATVVSLSQVELDAAWQDYAVVELEWQPGMAARERFWDPDNGMEIRLGNAWRAEAPPRLTVVADSRVVKDDWTERVGRFLRDLGLPQGDDAGWLAAQFEARQADEDIDMQITHHGVDLGVPGDADAVYDRLGGRATAEETHRSARERSLVWETDDGTWTLRLSVTSKTMRLGAGAWGGPVFIEVAADDLVWLVGTPEGRGAADQQGWLRERFAAEGLPEPSFHDWHHVPYC